MAEGTWQLRMSPYIDRLDRAARAAGPDVYAFGAFDYGNRRIIAAGVGRTPERVRRLIRSFPAHVHACWLPTRYSDRRIRREIRAVPLHDKAIVLAHEKKNYGGIVVGLFEGAGATQLDRARRATLRVVDVPVSFVRTSWPVAM